MSQQPLFLASHEGDLDWVRALLAAGANVEAPFNDTTALTVAALHGHLDIAVALLDAGAMVDGQVDPPG